MIACVAGAVPIVPPPRTVHRLWRCQGPWLASYQRRTDAGLECIPGVECPRGRAPRPGNDHVPGTDVAAAPRGPARVRWPGDDGPAGHHPHRRRCQRRAHRRRPDRRRRCRARRHDPVLEHPARRRVLTGGRRSDDCSRPAPSRSSRTATSTDAR
ncbi:hypothetical protein ACFFX0_27095 [Citricoccus parietis]|uniref:Uncharacterized protein n=1 Tax=Citricoccus parietis TaxID=592307 RepID=A0ABV5G6S6_9MICC